MQIVIDIPEEMFQTVKNGNWCGNHVIGEAIRNGIPLPEYLNKIKAEIIELRSKQNVGVLECLDIIDKYITELNPSYNSVKTELEPCEDWKFYYKHGYEQARNDVLDKIMAEIKALSNANPSYTHTCDVVDREDVLDIIDKYKVESEGEGEK